MKPHPTRNALAKSLVLCAVMVLALSLAACSTVKQSNATVGNDAKGTLQGAPSTTSKYTTTTPPTSSTSAEAATYSGTDSEQILSKLCALSGCHDLGELQKWTGDAKTVQETIDGMAGISKLSKEQSDALVKYYGSK